MKKRFFIICTLCLLFVSCSTDESGDIEKDYKNLEKMYSEILILSKINSETCTDSQGWDFTAVGSKSCGGPTGYIAYSKKIDKNQFLAKVKIYTDTQASFNIKWNISSTCNILLPPSSVDCVDGKPKLVYLTL